MKIAGAILILCASVASSYFYEKREKEKIRKANELTEFIRYIRAQIAYFSLPTDKIFKNYKSDDPFIEDIISGKLCSLDSFFDKDTTGVIKNFFSSLGNGYKDEQLAMCDFTLSATEDFINKMNKEFSGKVKVFRSMALFTGVCIIILLI